MPPDQPLPSRPGDIRELAGYFTQAFVIRMQSGREIERRLGYRAGRLGNGWWLMFLTQMPDPSGFEYRGYTNLPDGRSEGHLPAGRHNPNAEDLLKAQGINLTGTSYQREGLKQKTIAGFSLSGTHRLAKVWPVAREARESGVPDYPPGLGFPQWTLTRPLRWKAAAFIGPADVYAGNFD